MLFGGVVPVEAPDEQVAGLTGALAELASSQGLQVTATLTGVAPTRPARLDPRGIPAPGGGTRCTLALVGNDRPGIVRELSAILADLGVGIEELHTGTREAPMAGGQLFEARAQLALPDDVSLVQVSSAVEATAAELMVDIESPTTERRPAAASTCVTTVPPAPCVAAEPGGAAAQASAERPHSPRNALHGPVELAVDQLA